MGAGVPRGGVGGRGEIVKGGGKRISAGEGEVGVEPPPAVVDCAVVGMEDEEWGERVVAAVVVTAGVDLDLEEVRSFARDSLAAFKLPRQLIIVDALPRNALGKVVKPRVKEMIPPSAGS